MEVMKLITSKLILSDMLCLYTYGFLFIYICRVLTTLLVKCRQIDKDKGHSDQTVNLSTVAKSADRIGLSKYLITIMLLLR